jgi:hypothetical protein
MSTKLMAVDFEVFGKVSVISNLEAEFKGRWLRKIRGGGEVIVIQVLYGIVAIEGYFKFERVLSL